jgi:hypothetical protein
LAKYTIKQILLSNQSWWIFYTKHTNKLRPSIVSCVIKLLSCKNIIRGYRQYVCTNTNCTHAKYVHHTCKCRACSSCGKKATEIWIKKQNQILPKTSWQHITFTMPEQLWHFFWCNRYLLNEIGKLAAKCIQLIAANKKVTPGIFIAIHTFGRDLKRNVHIHLSTTTGGISKDGTKWKKLFFVQSKLMKFWRYEIINLFRQAYQKQKISIPKTIQQQLSNAFTFNDFLNFLYKKTWIVNCSEPSDDHKITVEYLGRYTKRPAIAESKLKHYDGFNVTLRYLDHKTKTYRNLKLTAEQFIARFVRHIPDDGFRMIRYYGFLANRVRGQLLDKVYKLIGQAYPQNTQPPTYSELIQKNFNFDPLECILCGYPLALVAISFGSCRTKQLLGFHKELALYKKF